MFGGWFLQAGSNPNTSNIAMWDGTNWNSLQNGTNGYQVYALAFDSNSNQLYVGGSFSQAGSTPNTSNIAVWNGTNWNSIQSILFNDTNVNSDCISFDQISNRLFVPLNNGSVAIFNSTSSDWYFLQIFIKLELCLHLLLIQIQIDYMLEDHFYK